MPNLTDPKDHISPLAQDDLWVQKSIHSQIGALHPVGSGEAEQHVVGNGNLQGFTFGVAVEVIVGKQSAIGPMERTPTSFEVHTSQGKSITIEECTDFSRVFSHPRLRILSQSQADQKLVGGIAISVFR
jgi:hypothetical protein